jgi:hypothetical protein
VRAEKKKENRKATGRDKKKLHTKTAEKKNLPHVKKRKARARSAHTHTKKNKN